MKNQIVLTAKTQASKSQDKIQFDINSILAFDELTKSIKYKKLKKDLKKISNM